MDDPYHGEPLEELVDPELEFENQLEIEISFFEEVPEQIPESAKSYEDDLLGEEYLQEELERQKQEEINAMFQERSP